MGKRDHVRQPRGQGDLLVACVLPGELLAAIVSQPRRGGLEDAVAVNVQPDPSPVVIPGVAETVNTRFSRGEVADKERAVVVDLPDGARVYEVGIVIEIQAPVTGPRSQLRRAVQGRQDGRVTQHAAIVVEVHREAVVVDVIALDGQQIRLGIQNRRTAVDRQRAAAERDVVRADAGYRVQGQPAGGHLDRARDSQADEDRVRAGRLGQGGCRDRRRRPRVGEHVVAALDVEVIDGVARAVEVHGARAGTREHRVFARRIGHIPADPVARRAPQVVGIAVPFEAAARLEARRRRSPDIRAVVDRPERVVVGRVVGKPAYAMQNIAGQRVGVPADMVGICPGAASPLVRGAPVHPHVEHRTRSVERALQVGRRKRDIRGEGVGNTDLWRHRVRVGRGQSVLPCQEPPDFILICT